MRKCIAFVPCNDSHHAYRPCRCRAVSRAGFCRQHERAITGALLGLYAFKHSLRFPLSRPRTLSRMPVASQVPS